MKIVIAGASGFVGRALVQKLEQEGHSLLFLTRGKTDPQQRQIHWDPEQGVLERKEIEGADVWINLAGENIASGRWTVKRKEKILNSRVKGSRLLAEAAAMADRPPKVIINASAIGYYGDRGDEILTEESAVGTGFLPEVCRAWEEALAPAEKAGVRVVKMRFGVVLGRDGGLLKRMLLPFKLGLGGVIGSGRQYMSWVALDDLVGALLFVMVDEECRGAYNVVAPEPVTNAEFTKTLGAVVHRPTLFPLPAFVARMVFGEMADGLMLSSARVLPIRLQKAGYTFRYPDLRQALIKS